MNGSTVLTIIGLVFDLIGGILLFFSVQRSDNVGTQDKDDGTSMPFQLTNERSILSKIGFSMFVLGALLQIIGLLCEY